MRPAAPLLDQATEAFRSGDLVHAQDCANAYLRAAGPHPDTFLLLARIATEVGRYDAAERLADNGIAMARQHAGCLAQRADARLKLGRPADARCDAIAALDAKDPTPEALDLTCYVFHTIGEFALAAEAQFRAVALEPDNPALLANLGAILVICGDLAGADRAYRRAIDISPENARALAGLSELRAATDKDNNIALIKRAIDKTHDIHTRLVLHHALAREFEATCEYDEAIATLTAGKEAMARQIRADPEKDRDLFAALQDIAKRPPRPLKARGCGVIFIVGLPRSGTTVIERIVSSPPNVGNIGESPLLPAIVRKVGGGRYTSVADGRQLQIMWPKLDFDLIGEAYVHHAGQAAGGAPIWVDKLPLNFQLVEVIAAALPEAKILWATRDPMDCIVGNFRQMFEYRSGSYNYGLSLASTAAFVADAHDYRAIMEAKHANQILTVRLEELIASPETVAGQIAKHCSIEYSEEAWKIEGNRRPVASASAASVRAPLSSKHLGRASKFGPALSAAQAVLARRRVTI